MNVNIYEHLIVSRISETRISLQEFAMAQFLTWYFVTTRFMFFILALFTQSTNSIERKKQQLKQGQTALIKIFRSIYEKRKCSAMKRKQIMSLICNRFRGNKKTKQILAIFIHMLYLK